jgi:hypothetical protein
MAYADFSLDSVADDLGLNIITVDLFPDLVEAPVPPWLRDALERGGRQLLANEKAKSEFIVAPILLACQEQSPGPLSILSGLGLDVDPDRELVGECGFILSATKPIPAMRAPLVTIVEVKVRDVEDAIWPCFARMMGAEVFNKRAGQPIGEVFGCVTDGDCWQFLRLAGDLAEIDRRRYYLSKVGLILAALGWIFERHAETSRLAK